MSEDTNAGPSPKQVTNTEFLAKLYEPAPEGTDLWVNQFIGDPNTPAASWGGQRYTAQDHHECVADTWRSYNTYYCVAALKANQDGEVRRKKANFARLLALVVDDADWHSLLDHPSYVLATSPGNCQVGVFLDADCPDCENMELVAALVNVMAKLGFMKADTSGNNVVRYVRLPIGSNHKTRVGGGIVYHEMLQWLPQVRKTLDEAAHLFGIDLDDVKKALANGTTMSADETAAAVNQNQADKLKEAVSNVIQGSALHESLNAIEASLVASGMHAGAVVNTVRAIMDSSMAPRDDRWKARYADIPRAVQGAVEQFSRPGAVYNAEKGVIEDAPLEEFFVPVADGLDDVEDVKWLVKNYIEEDALVMMYGPSSGGKSFVAIDLASCISTGHSWHHNPTKRSAVFYVAGEGFAGLKKRFAAWQKKNVQLDRTTLFRSKGAVQLMTEQSAKDLAAHIDNMVKIHGVAPGAVVIDTLARNLGPGDENSAKDVGLFIEHVDRYIRKRWGCTVIIVHHSGHNGERARGSSALKAAMDQELEVSNEFGIVTLKVTKMKDAEVPGSICFKIQAVDIGKEGSPIQGAYLQLHGDVLSKKIATSKALGDITCRQALEYVRDNGSARTQMVQALQVNGSAHIRILDDLKTPGWIEKVGPNQNDGYRVSALGMAALAGNGSGLKVGQKHTTKSTSSEALDPRNDESDD